MLNPSTITNSHVALPNLDAPLHGDQSTIHQHLSRREFMTYSFGAAVALLAAEVGGVTYSFLLPRFRAGEFGGTFEVDNLADLPAPTADPKPYANGKFWLVNTENGPKALYMVCTHLGCLYEWEPTQQLFRCPCHDSNFDREGNLVKGPATRSLDQFVVSTAAGKLVVDTGQKIRGESPA